MKRKSYGKRVGNRRSHACATCRRVASALVKSASKKVHSRGRKRIGHKKKK